MNFYELCRKTALDCGTVAGVPSFLTVTGASGRVEQLVGWVRDAYRDIQNERSDWLWLQQSFSHALTIGQKVYSFSDLGLTRGGSFKHDTPEMRSMTLYDPATGVADEGEIFEVPYETWVRKWMRGFNDPNRPGEWAMSPQRTLCLGPAPDKAYVLSGFYRASAQELVADADVPEMPEQFHMLIVAEAIRLMARSDEAIQVVVEKTDQYMRLRNPLVIDQTPAMTMGIESFA